jgi:predicted nucleotidyltransferase
MSKNEVKKVVKKYSEKLKAEGYPFSAVYLFGSYAGGKARKDSDIDVAVLSSRLKNNWNKNEDILWKYVIGVDSRIEPVGLTEKDFKRNDDPLVSEIKKTGIRIA